jgi:hypothetical protein
MEYTEDDPQCWGTQEYDRKLKSHLEPIYYGIY